MVKLSLVKNKIKTSKISKKNKINKQQRGGVKIGEGGEGCVVKPHIPCKKNIKGDYITKIIKLEDENDRTNAYNELLIHKLLFDIDTKNKYFITIIDICPIEDNIDRNNVSYTNVSKRLKNKCKIEPNSEYLNYIMPYGGLNLDDVVFMKKYNNIRYLININFRSLIKHLLLGLKKMHQNYIIHHDIKLDNIAIKKVNNKLFVKYLDFGFAENIKSKNIKIYDNISFTAFGSPSYMPTDMFITSQIITHMSKHSKIKLLDPNYKYNNLNDIYYELNDKNLDIYRYSIGLNSKTLKISKSKKKDIVSFNDIINIYNMLSKQVINNVFLKDYYKHIDGYVYKYDIYSLGIVFFQLYKNCKIDTNDDILDLIRHMIKNNPQERYNINQCLKHKFFTKN